MTAEKVPLRPASPIDTELAKPHPEDLTEIEKEAERAETTPPDEKAEDERDLRRGEDNPKRSDT
jgi:hypothetical protein